MPLMPALLFSGHGFKFWPEKENQVGGSSHNFIFGVVNPIVLEKTWTDGESWPKNFDKENRGEDLRLSWGCPLMAA